MTSPASAIGSRLEAAVRSTPGIASNRPTAVTKIGPRAVWRLHLSGQEASRDYAHETCHLQVTRRKNARLALREIEVFFQKGSASSRRRPSRDSEQAPVGKCDVK